MGEQKDDGARRGLRTTDCKQSRLMGLQSWSWMTMCHCSSYSNDIRHSTAEEGELQSVKTIYNWVTALAGRSGCQVHLLWHFPKVLKRDRLKLLPSEQNQIFQKLFAMSYEEWTGESRAASKISGCLSFRPKPARINITLRPIHSII